MPAAVASGVQINGPLKNKKIVFNDDGEALVKQNKEKHNKKASKQKHQNGKPAHNGQEQVKKPQRIKFGDDGDIEEVQISKSAPKVEPAKKGKQLLLDATGKVKKPQRIKFDDDGAEKELASESEKNSDDEDAWKSTKPNKYQAHTDDDDAQKKWYQVYTEYPSSDEVLDMKENEQMELFNLCKASFEAEKSTYNKRNPTDARWLNTALHKGTAKDRANAGALLVTSNPLGNLDALSNLIGFCKISNKSSNDVIAVLTDLWQEVLLPPQRKLLSIHMRGADWKLLKKQELHKEQSRRIYAYWYFENELKDQYHEYLKNLMQALQTGQEHNKTAGIVAAGKLLAYAPEKEQMLLTMLINKLGDPIPKIASKALHHLSEVTQKHPNMCGVIVAEAEKLLFRNNISERAQHFALCFLSSMAPSGRPEVCTKLVNICFALFKVLVQKGAVNNRTMQAILRCLQKAISEAQPSKGNTELLTKEMQDTIYRLVHLADIRVSVQTLGLLLQLVTVKSEKSDRFYNALYIKLLDLNLINIGGKTAAQLLHIVHRAIHVDKHVARAQAFVKRLLQLSLYAPPNMSAGCLIVLHKLLRMRRELVAGIGDVEMAESAKQLLPAPAAEDLDKFGSDTEEVYKDADVEPTADAALKDEKQDEKPANSSSSWHHVKLAATESKVRNIDACKYDPYHRVPAFAGAGYALRNELLLLRQHYHPTVQVFAEQILLEKRIDYYGDPLRDFGLPHFLERFAFKNPKKFDHQHVTEAAHKRYTAFGARGKPVKSLTKTTCTEDEMFIFNYLEHKRKQAELMEQSKKQPQPKIEDETLAVADDELKEGEVDDDEFESYLDGFFGKKAKESGAGEHDEDELNFLQELGGELQAAKSKKKQKKKKDTENDDMDDVDDDWGDDGEDEEADEHQSGAEADDQSDDETGSLDFEHMEDNDDDEDDEDDDDEDGAIDMGGDSDTSEAPESPDEDDNDDDDDAPKSKKSRKTAVLNERGFAQKLKHSNDVSSLFVADDHFSALLEETGKSKGQGTSNAMFNKDKSSDKQMKWEEKRRSNSKNYTSKKFAGGNKPKLGKKRKH